MSEPRRELNQRVKSTLTVYDGLMLRRAAEACRNVVNHVEDAAWFSWVPRYLEKMADRAGPQSETGGVES